MDSSIPHPAVISLLLTGGFPGLHCQVPCLAMSEQAVDNKYEDPWALPRWFDQNSPRSIR